MTTSLSSRTLGIDATPSVPGPIPFSRLLRAEWAKATDTRAARWLLGLVALSMVALVAVAIAVPERFDQSYAGYLEAASIGQVIFMPLVALLMLTSEWSQRSIMTTFTQEPRRIRVVNAKLVVSLMLGGGAALLGGVVAAAGLGIAAASGRALEANIGVGIIAGYLVYLLLNVLAGAAFGASLQNSATAIGGYFALNVAVALLGDIFNVIGNWVDTETIWQWVLDNDWGGHVPQISFTVLLWVAAPLAVGVVRTMRRDVG